MKLRRGDKHQFLYKDWLFQKLGPQRWTGDESSFQSVRQDLLAK
jgi:hypothetical protein